MFEWLKRKSTREGTEATEPKVGVFLTPLVILLKGRETQKGAPLTREEVLAIRDSAQYVLMTELQAEKFYAHLDAQVLIPRIDPELCWEEWQMIREQLE